MKEMSDAFEAGGNPISVPEKGHGPDQRRRPRASTERTTTASP